MTIYKPKEAAEAVGKVEKSNYLSHSIRKIEQLISKSLGKHYRVIVTVSAASDNAWIHFSERSCEIWLPSECDKIDDKKIRLTLAHELGHIFFNFEKLKTPEILDAEEASNEEELFSWEFAFHLVKIKSSEHRSDIERKKHIYDDDDLKAMLSALVKTRKPEIYDDIVQSLSLPKFIA